MDFDNFLHKKCDMEVALVQHTSMLVAFMLVWCCFFIIVAFNHQVECFGNFLDFSRYFPIFGLNTIFRSFQIYFHEL